MNSKKKINIFKLSYTKTILLTAFWFLIFYNYAFYKNVFKVYPVNIDNILFLLSVTLVLYCAIVLVLLIFCHKYTIKPVIILLLIISSATAYFINNYNIVIDDVMVLNIIQSDTSEISDTLNLKLFLYLIILGILPSIIILFLPLKNKSFWKECYSKIKIFFLILLIIIISYFSFSKYYASFLREHKPLRYYTNPTYYIYSVYKSIDKYFLPKNKKLTLIGHDAHISETDIGRELCILVVGEAARADRFSLNGYKRETNPLLKKENIISFSDMHSLGTSTAISVPYMFSFYKKFSKAKQTENILDVLKKAGVSILWRDNNSSSKGVADRVAYQNYQSPETNTIHDIECRDEGMLIGLDKYIKSHKKGDILIVLHQKGSHGPDYYKRYPAKFEKFKPVKKTNQLENCTEEEINNAYDNTILYTDYFLSKVIQFLKKYSDKFKTVMFYMSDHGESLGENGIYLHGLPYVFAPENQIHIPAIIWFGKNFRKELDISKLKEKSKQAYSQDILFNTLLGIFEVNTSIYKPKRDFINTDRKD